MIQKVQDAEKISMLDNQESLRRPSINQVAMDSFTDVVVDSSQKMIQKGSSVAECAAKYKLDPKFLQNLLNERGTQKIACACENDSQPEPQKADPLSAATDAYNSLHNTKTVDHTFKDACRKRILTNKGDVTDVGGPSRQMKFDHANLILDTDRVEKLSKVKDNGERLKAEKTAIAEQDKKRRHQSLCEIDAASLSNLLEGKAAGVTTTAAPESINYDNKLPARGISIFDSGDYDRIPEKTAAENRREEIEKVKQQPKDRSWIERGSKCVTTSDIFDKFIDSMVNNKKV